MKVLMSAYACEPGKGSEPEVGWQWVNHLSEHVEVHVLTRLNNKEAIEDQLENSDEHVHFHYHDLPLWVLKIKKRFMRGNLGASLYYWLWQRSAKKKAEAIIDENKITILHHLTFASYRLPFIRCRSRAVKRVIGPVGGCEDFPSRLLSSLPLKVLIKEKIRNWIIWISNKRIADSKAYQEADQILASTKEMKAQFDQAGINKVRVLPTIGIHACERADRSSIILGNQTSLKLLFVGNLLYWKGLNLAIQALTECDDNITLDCIGSGGDREQLEALVNSLKLSERVRFLGRIDREILLNMYKEYDVFVYPSIHDSGSFTVLEAMYAELPVICLNRGGPSLSVTPETGVLIESTSSKDDVISKVATAIESYSKDRKLIYLHGKNGKDRICDHYDWTEKAKCMYEIYLSL